MPCFADILLTRKNFIEPPPWVVGADRECFEEIEHFRETLPNLPVFNFDLAQKLHREVTFDRSREKTGREAMDVFDYQVDFPCVAPPFPQFFVEWRHFASSYSGALVEAHGNEDKSGWTLRVTYLMHQSGANRVFFPYYLCEIDLLKDGRITGDRRDSVVWDNEEKEPDDNMSMFFYSGIMAFETVLYGLSLINCRNVSVLDNPPPERLIVRRF